MSLLWLKHWHPTVSKSGMQMMREPQGTWKALRHGGTHYVARGLHLVTIRNQLKWLVVKPDYEDKARAVFKGSDVNITVKGRKYLGSPIGTLAFCESFSMDKVSEWAQELEDLAKIAVNDP